jgi:hypothetical protein
MTRSILSFLTAAIILTTFACDPRTDKIAKPEPKPNTLPVSAIPLDTAISYIRMYSELCRKQNIPAPDAIRAFTIPRNDLFDLLGMDTLPCGSHISFSFDRARAYIGYTSFNKQFHLVFTPVIDDGSVSGRDTILTDSEGTRIVFDLTTPCPNTCDFSSKLYRAFDNK